MARRMLNLERVTQIASMLDGEERVDVLKKTIVELLDAYAKSSRRLEKITRLSDRQQVRVLRLNESLEAANAELDIYKTDLEQKVDEETSKRVLNEKILLQNGKMAEMGNMLGAIVHQWKQPISIIGILTDVIIKDYENGELDIKSAIEDIKTIKERSHFLSETIDDFRNFFKPDKEAREFCLRETVEEIVKIVSHQAVINGITIEVCGGKGEHTIGLPNEIKHVLLNLMNNSMEAIIENRQKISGEPKIRIEIREDTDKTKLSIMDNGGGIPQKIMENLFLPYNSTKGEAGTGIGLTLAKTIIEEHHGGTIDAKNIDGGAVFLIEWPKISYNSSFT